MQCNSVHLAAHFCIILVCPKKEFNFFHIFEIPSWSRHEKCCQILQTLLWVFQYSRDPQCTLILAMFWKFSLISVQTSFSLFRLSRKMESSRFKADYWQVFSFSNLPFLIFDYSVATPQNMKKSLQYVL